MELCKCGCAAEGIEEQSAGLGICEEARGRGGGDTDNRARQLK